MKIKLAQYNEQEKFERFLELGKDFLFGGTFIEINFHSNYEFFDREEVKTFYKDEKDPLNRFDRLFDGRTYGEGRFVLIAEDQDNLIKGRTKYGDYFYFLEGDTSHDHIEDWAESEIIGNLHENSKLPEKYKINFRY